MGPKKMDGMRRRCASKLRGKAEAQIIIESWRRHYNTIRPHASIGYKPPAPEVFVPALAAWPAALRQPAPPATLAQRPTLN
jgi:transposase InsO family protein